MARLNFNQQQTVMELLRSLVKINSVNENDEQANRDKAEKEIGDFVYQYLSGLGMQVTRHALAEGRDSLVAHWPNQDGPKSIAFQAHMDTVSVKNMEIAPFGGGINDGKMWGRGTCDTKGSLAAFLHGLSVIKKKNLRMRDKLYFVATVGEETGCKGAGALVTEGFKVDAMVVGEPTMSRVVTAHKGTVWLRVTASGTSCHASRPELGKNAIYALSRALRFVEEDYLPSLSGESHPLLGNPTVSVGTIEGGTATNILPSSATATLDLRVLPGRSPFEVVEDFSTRLHAAVPGETFELETLLSQPGVDTPTDSPWVKNLLGPCREKAGQTDAEGVHYFADSGPFHEAGISCVLFGPGDIAQAHTKDEFLDLEQLYLASEIVLDWIETGCAQSLVSENGTSDS